MSDYLDRLLQRTLGRAPLVQPVVGTRFGSEPVLLDEQQEEGAILGLEGEPGITRLFERLPAPAGEPPGPRREPEAKVTDGSDAGPTQGPDVARARTNSSDGSEAAETRPASTRGSEAAGTRTDPADRSAAAGKRTAAEDRTATEADPARTSTGPRGEARARETPGPEGGEERAAARTQEAAGTEGGPERAAAGTREATGPEGGIERAASGTYEAPAPEGGAARTAAEPPGERQADSAPDAPPPAEMAPPLEPPIQPRQAEPGFNDGFMADLRVPTTRPRPRSRRSSAAEGAGEAIQRRADTSAAPKAPAPDPAQPAEPAEAASATSEPAQPTKQPADSAPPAEPIPTQAETTSETKTPPESPSHFDRASSRIGEPAPADALDEATVAETAPPARFERSADPAKEALAPEPSPETAGREAVPDSSPEPGPGTTAPEPATAAETEAHATGVETRSRAGVDEPGETWLTNNEPARGTPLLERSATEVRRRAGDRQGPNERAPAGADQDGTIQARSDPGGPEPMRRDLAETAPPVRQPADDGAPPVRQPTPDRAPPALPADARDSKARSATDETAATESSAAPSSTAPDLATPAMPHPAEAHSTDAEGEAPTGRPEKRAESAEHPAETQDGGGLDASSTRPTIPSDLEQEGDLPSEKDVRPETSAEPTGADLFFEASAAPPEPGPPRASEPPSPDLERSSTTIRRQAADVPIQRQAPAPTGSDAPIQRQAAPAPSGSDAPIERPAAPAPSDAAGEAPAEARPEDRPPVIVERRPIRPELFERPPGEAGQTPPVAREHPFANAPSGQAPAADLERSSTVQRRATSDEREAGEAGVGEARLAERAADGAAERDLRAAPPEDVERPVPASADDPGEGAAQRLTAEAHPSDSAPAIEESPAEALPGPAAEETLAAESAADDLGASEAPPTPEAGEAGPFEGPIQRRALGDPIAGPEPANGVPLARTESAAADPGPLAEEPPPDASPADGEPLAWQPPAAGTPAGEISATLQSGEAAEAESFEGPIQRRALALPPTDERPPPGIGEPGAESEPARPTAPTATGPPASRKPAPAESSEVEASASPVQRRARDAAPAASEPAFASPSPTPAGSEADTGQAVETSPASEPPGDNSELAAEVSSAPDAPDASNASDAGEASEAGEAGEAGEGEAFEGPIQRRALGELPAGSDATEAGPTPALPELASDEPAEQAEHSPSPTAATPETEPRPTPTAVAKPRPAQKAAAEAPDSSQPTGDRPRGAEIREPAGPGEAAAFEGPIQRRALGELAADRKATEAGPTPAPPELAADEPAEQMERALAPSARPPATDPVQPEPDKPLPIQPEPEAFEAPIQRRALGDAGPPMESAGTAPPRAPAEGGVETAAPGRGRDPGDRASDATSFEPAGERSRPQAIRIPLRRERQDELQRLQPLVHQPAPDFREPDFTRVQMRSPVAAGTPPAWDDTDLRPAEEPFRTEGRAPDRRGAQALKTATAALAPDALAPDALAPEAAARDLSGPEAAAFDIEAADAEGFPDFEPHGFEPPTLSEHRRQPAARDRGLEIHIGKIEVRTPPPPPAPPAPEPFQPRLSLAEYLRQRRAGLR